MILHGNALEVLRTLPEASVHCVVTSPPYWSLRDYKVPATVWGGDASCQHEWESAGSVEGYTSKKKWQHSVNGRGEQLEPVLRGDNPEGWALIEQGKFCVTCHAWLGCLGLEPTPELYVEHLVSVFEEVRRVLRDDGTLWLNLGDCYAAGGRGGNTGGASTLQGSTQHQEESKRAGHRIGCRSSFRRDRMPRGDVAHKSAPGLKPKDLVGIPWAVAEALKAPRYNGRLKKERDRVWVAAIMDGEGSISAFHHIRSDDGSPRSGINICVTNSNKDLLNKLQRLWPGSSTEHMGNERLGKLPVERWLIHGVEEKTQLLREIYPELVAKRRQALVAYNLLRLMSNAKRLGHTPQRDDVRELRRKLTEMLSSLNHQRPVDLPDWLEEPPTVMSPGWYLRSDIIWSKTNPMPESTQDRPTKSHEYLFLLAKTEEYFYDAHAIREVGTQSSLNRVRQPNFDNQTGGPKDRGRQNRHTNRSSRKTLENFAKSADGSRNRRSVWTLPTAPFPGAHFATFPVRLVEPCILAGTSDHGCCSICGAPFTRIVEKGAELIEQKVRGGSNRDGKYHGKAKKAYDGTGAQDPSAVKARILDGMRERITVGWKPGCRHTLREIEPGTVLDPFAGAGTTALVADRLKRNFIGVELNAEYVGIAETRRKTTIDLAELNKRQTSEVQA